MAGVKFSIFLFNVHVVSEEKDIERLRLTFVKCFSFYSSGTFSSVKKKTCLVFACFNELNE